MIHLDKSLTATEMGLRPALAANLYKQGVVSLGKAARISALSLSNFINHLASLSIEIVTQNETTDDEIKDVSAWLSS